MWPPGLIHIRRKDQNDLINIARNNNNNESFTAVEIYDRNGSTGYNKNVNRRKRNINIPLIMCGSKKSAHNSIIEFIKSNKLENVKAIVLVDIITLLILV